jgi:hypothetical protein
MSQLHPSAWRPQFVIASHCATGTSPTNTMVTRLTVSLPRAFRCWVCALVETARRTPVNEGTSSRLSRDLKCIDDADPREQFEGPIDQRARPEKLMVVSKLSKSEFHLQTLCPF